MIVKRGATPEDLGIGFEGYVAKEHVVLAKRMQIDFLIETGKGWEQCKAGMWLVCIDSDLWISVDHAQFQKVFSPAHRAPA